MGGVLLLLRLFLLLVLSNVPLSRFLAFSLHFHSLFSVDDMLLGYFNTGLTP